MKHTQTAFGSVIVILLLVLLIVPPVSALEKVGTTSMQVLKIPVGVRGIGMGSAMVGATSGADAVWWNPAALADMKGNHVSLAQINMPADIQLNALSYARGINDYDYISIHAINLFTDDMPVRTVSRPTGTGENFNASDFVMGIGYCHKMFDRFSLGGNIRYLHSSIHSESFDGFSFDLGTLYRTGLRSLRLGMSIQNLGQDVEYSGDFLDYREAGRNDEDPTMESYEGAALPTMFRLGIAFDLFEMMQWNQEGEANVHGADIAVEMDHPNDNQERLNLGGEYSYDDMLFLRLGGKFGYDEESFAAGFGLKFQVMGDYWFTLDYAYSHMGRITEAVDDFAGQPHRFALGFCW